MAQEEDKTLTPEQVAELNANGRVSNVDKAIADQQAKDEAEIEADKAKNPAELKAAADKKVADDKAAEEARKTEEEAAAKDDDGKWKAEWVQLGNPHADAAIEMMKAAGMSPVEGNAVFEKAIASGKLTDVNWEVLEARVGKQQAFLVRTGIENYYNGEYKAQQELVNYAYENVGGEAGWASIQKWAGKAEKSDAAFAGRLAEYRRAIDSGGFAGRAAVDAIKAEYEKAPGNSSLKTANTTIERGKAANTATVEGTPLTRGQYFSEMEKAGGDRAPAHIKAALAARRNAGREQGI